MQETDRRRGLQMAYNEKHGITPKTIIKPIGTDIAQTIRSRKEATDAVAHNDKTVYITEELIEELQTEMLKAAEDLEFERAGILRDRIGQLKNAMGEPLDSVDSKSSSGGKKGKRRGRKASKRRGSKVPRPRKQD
jgi:excinuclease ABC subunit B